MKPDSTHSGPRSTGPGAPARPLDYETPRRPRSAVAGRKAARRALAMALLAIGLFFGLAETAVFMLGVFAIRPFDDMRRDGLAARAAAMIPVGVISLTGYAVASIGYFLDRARTKKAVG
jgi:hypothetical protein